jgi:hypothetical protein
MREKVGPKLRSGAVEIPRDLRSGKQSIESENSESSLYKEMPKIEAMSQVTGFDFVSKLGKSNSTKILMTDDVI